MARAREISRRVMAMSTALAACVLALASCSQGGAAAAPDGGTAAAPDGGAATAPDGGAAADPDGGALNCQQIRMRVFEAACADDACVQRYAAKGGPEARTTFEALRACTAKACPTLGDVNCACGEQCQADGACLHEADACVGTVTVDDICDSLCA